MDMIFLIYNKIKGDFLRVLLYWRMLGTDSIVIVTVMVAHFVRGL